MPSNSEIVFEFTTAWSNMDIDKVMSFFAEDAEYANIPMGPPNVGKEAIRQFIDGFVGTASAIEFIVHHQVEGGDGIVMNERTDKITIGGNQVDLPVMGIFELRDGKIRAWRDYFDMGPFTSGA